MTRRTKVESPEEFEKRAQAYFDLCAATDEPVTLTGLVLAVGLNSKQALHYCKNERAGFKDVVEWALLNVEHYNEKGLHGKSGVGCIFVLKNMGWTDKQELAHSGQVTLTHEQWLKELK